MLASVSPLAATPAPAPTRPARRAATPAAAPAPLAWLSRPQLQLLVQTLSAAEDTAAGHELAQLRNLRARAERQLAPMIAAAFT